MNPATIITQAMADGVTLTLSATGSIKAAGDSAAVNRWLPVIREHKAGIIDVLKVGDGYASSTSQQWLLHFTDRSDLPVMFASAIEHAAVLDYYPDAVAAEPISERPQRKATKAEAEEITALVQAVYANDTDDDRAEALVAALADPDGALLCYRTIAKDRGIAIAAPVVGTVTACQCCQHYTRPGKSDGYCGGRDDLAPAYGVNHPLRRLPVNRGASCDDWKAS